MVVHCDYSFVLIFFPDYRVTFLLYFIELTFVRFSVSLNTVYKQCSFIIDESETGKLVVRVASDFLDWVNNFFHFWITSIFYFCLLAGAKEHKSKLIRFVNFVAMEKINSQRIWAKNTIVKEKEPNSVSSLTLLFNMEVLSSIFPCSWFSRWLMLQQPRKKTIKYGAYNLLTYLCC